MPNHHHFHRILIILAIGIMLSATPLSAQEGAWKLYSYPSARTDAALAQMDDNGRILLFGGAGETRFLSDTWIFYSGSWKRVLKSGPSSRSRAAIAYDANRHVVVLFGGMYRDTVLGDTWEWNGKRWKQKAKNQRIAPAAREGASMAFDPARGTTVLFGGRNGDQFNADTWEWNGRAWKLITVAIPPSPRTKQAMAWCESAGGIVLFGGLNVTQQVGDTWLFQDGDWHQLSGRGPSAREAAAMTSLPDGGVLLLGGAKGNRVLSDRWVFDGTAWKKTKGKGPSARAGAGLAPLAATQQTLLFGGWNKGVVNNDTWTLSLTYWSHLSEFAPSPRVYAAMAWDPVRRRLVLFGGTSTDAPYLDDTWEWNSHTGWQHSLATGPSARAGASMAWDPTRNAVVLYGGRYSSSAGYTQYTDTWSFDGYSWTLINGDGPTNSGAMAYSPTRGTLVALEGNDGSFPTAARTLELSGDTWQELISPSAPDGRTRAAMAQNAGNLYLFGGYGYHWSRSWPYCYNDLWVLLPGGWSQILTDNPPGRQDYVLGFIPGRADLFLHGGTNVGHDPNSWSEYYAYLWRSLSETWYYTGTEWKFLSYLGPARDGHCLAWVDDLNALVLFGGEDKQALGGTRYFNDLWVLDPNYGKNGTHDINFVSASINKEDWASGDTVKVNAVIRNTGPGAAPAMKMNLYLSLDEHLDDADTLVGSMQLAAIPLNYTGLTFTTKIDAGAAIARIPSAILAQAQRNRFYLIAALDDDEQSRDRNWANNRLTISPVITITP